MTTGPMTVPFIMALGVGFSSVRGDKGGQDDSFGLVSLCSVGPILMVLLLGIFLSAGFRCGVQRRYFHIDYAAGGNAGICCHDPLLF
ncbi:MAG: DUF1538 domain-containing protein [Lachnospiraceae bacterium]|nr:DUF1538 domain-containing protein [Lachnospiraceae bacterium]